MRSSGDEQVHLGHIDDADHSVIDAADQDRHLGHIDDADHSVIAVGPMKGFCRCVNLHTHFLADHSVVGAGSMKVHDGCIEGQERWDGERADPAVYAARGESR